jgi:hypothetical protein
MIASLNTTVRHLSLAASNQEIYRRAVLYRPAIDIELMGDFYFLITLKLVTVPSVLMIKRR